MSSIISFFKPKTNEEKIREWQQEIRKGNREIKRSITAIERKEAEVKKDIKAAAKRKDIAGCKILAKHLVRSHRKKNQLNTSIRQMESINMQLKEQLATLKVAGTLQKSNEVMSLVNSLVKLPEISKIMQDMSMEMTKAGIMSEMIDDTMEILDDDDIEEAADEEVNAILLEVTGGMFGQISQEGSGLPKSVAANKEEEEEEEGEEETNPELGEMQRRLEALKS